MSEADTLALIDRIYDAAFVPDEWRGVFEIVSKRTNSVGGALFVTNEHGTRWIADDQFGRVVEDFVKRGMMAGNPRLSRLISSGYLGFASDLDLMTEREWTSHPMYTDFCVPHGIGWAAGTMIPSPSGDIMIFTVERRTHVGPFLRAELDGLDLLRPHLARSALLAARLKLEHARAAVGGLEAFGIPAAVVGSRQRVVAANAGFEKLGRQIIALAHGRVALAGSAANRFLADALRSLGDRRPPRLQSFPVPAVEYAPAFVLHVVPLRRNASDIFSGEAILAITLLSADRRPPAGLLAGLFDLTPAETRIAAAILEGRTTDETAAQAGVALDTVRKQVKSVLAKAGVSRKVEFVAMLGGLQGARSADGEGYRFPRSTRGEEERTRE